MKHLGDITKIDWSKIENVDCVIGGSPCQNLSLAGNKEGLDGSEQKLYIEEIRCVKELRQGDIKNGKTGKEVKPRYMVWENVPGVFSCNKGKDFKRVLEEAISVVEEKFPELPMSEKGWSKSGYIYDQLGNWSIAWRTHDSKYWGVPQRRKRIQLVCDFGGLTAKEILFEPKSV